MAKKQRAAVKKKERPPSTALTLSGASGGLPGHSLQAYLTAVRQLPMMSAEEERETARQYRDTKDIDAARALVMSHLRFVAYVARSFRGYGQPDEDLIQVGTLGLIKGIQRFDPEHGVRLVTFVVHWIRAEMQEYVLHNWKIVRVATTKAQRKLFFKSGRLRASETRSMTKEEVDALAEDLCVDPSVVREMEKRLKPDETSLDVPLGDGNTTRLDVLPAREDSPDDAFVEKHDGALMVSALETALMKLDERTRDIVMSRHLVTPKKKLRELGAKYDLSEERIRQIEKKGLSQLRNTMDVAFAPALTQ